MTTAGRPGPPAGGATTALVARLRAAGCVLAEQEAADHADVPSCVLVLRPERRTVVR